MMLLLLSFFSTKAQIEFGIKGGFNSIDLVSDGIKINDGIKNLQINFKDASYGHHFGIYTRLSFLGIFIEPSVLFNSNKVSYTLVDYNENGLENTLLNETYNDIDIPVMVGLKAGAVRFFAGPVGHLHINNTSELTDINGYKEKFKNLKYGYQAGFGIDVWKLRFDISYENNLDKFGDHITIDGNDYAFSDSSARILGTVGFKF